MGFGLQSKYKFRGEKGERVREETRKFWVMGELCVFLNFSPSSQVWLHKTIIAIRTFFFVVGKNISPLYKIGNWF